MIFMALACAATTALAANTASPTFLWDAVMSAPATAIMDLSALKAGMYMLRLEGP